MLNSHLLGMLIRQSPGPRNVAHSQFRANDPAHLQRVSWRATNAIVTQIANSLQAIVAPRLLPRADGQGQLLATEVCVVNHAIRNHIRERDVRQIYSVIQTGRKAKMQTMDSSMFELYQQGDIGYDMAVSNVKEPATIRPNEPKSTP